jgi:hypothetical protein
MDQVAQLVQNNGQMIGKVVFVGFLLYALYIVYTYLYPAGSPTLVSFLSGQADARKRVTLDTQKVPTIYTGGDFTVSMWLYVDDWNYKASNNKFVFSVKPKNGPVNVLNGVLMANQNNLLITASRLPNSRPSESHLPDLSNEQNLQQLLKNQTSVTMFKDLNDTLCNMVEIPLQRWVCLTVVVNGNTMDTYVNGKLRRSCVLPSVVHVPSGPLEMRLGEHGGFGGRYSSVQMWNQQLTPDVIYGIYQQGPNMSKGNFFARFAKMLNVDINFLETDVDCAAVASAYSSLKENGDNLLARF